jgi:hypothetical protein
MDRGYAAPLFIVFEHGKDVPHVLNGFRQGPIDYREPVVFDVGEAHCLCASREIGSVCAELVDFGQINEGPDAGCEQSFYLLFRNARTPGVFAGEKERGGPVGVRDWALEDGVNGCVPLLLGKQDIDAVLRRRESNARQGRSGHL